MNRLLDKARGLPHGLRLSAQLPQLLCVKRLIAILKLVKCTIDLAIFSSSRADVVALPQLLRLTTLLGLATGFHFGQFGQFSLRESSQLTEIAKRLHPEPAIGHLGFQEMLLYFAVVSRH